MKQVEAIIKPFQLGNVQDALTKLGVEVMTVVEARGFGRQNYAFKCERVQEKKVMVI
jgi:nitrogen regulatory protein PII